MFLKGYLLTILAYNMARDNSQLEVSFLTMGCRSIVSDTYERLKHLKYANVVPYEGAAGQTKTQPNARSRGQLPRL
jgi:hypothetical protein